MERISKPHIVDLLRIFDRRRWFIPRIRYASVRSKPELIKDLKKYFFTSYVDKFQYDRKMTRFHLAIITRLRNSNKVWWFPASPVNLVTRLRPSKQSLVVFCQFGESDD